MKMIKFPDIGQFRQVVRDVLHQARFAGLDTNGEAVYDSFAPVPTIVCHGTVKLHGTNAGVTLDRATGEIWAQSRENVITPEKDNAGFAFFVESNKVQFIELFSQLKLQLDRDDDSYITIYGEWCGGNIQKGVAIANMDKSFFIFGVKVSPKNDEKPAYWIDHSYLRSPENKIYNIENFTTFDVIVDFNKPELSQNQFIDIVAAVEAECPVGKAFGHSGIGEGVVFTCVYKGNTLRFKCKGEKHSASKVKTVAEVDVEKISSCRAFAEYCVTESRVSQACEKIFGIGVTPDIKLTGQVIGWVMKDILKEEMDTLLENKLEPKDVNSYVASKTRELFMRMV